MSERVEFVELHPSCVRREWREPGWFISTVHVLALAGIVSWVFYSGCL